MKKYISLSLVLIMTMIGFAQQNLSIMSYNIRLASVDDGANHWNIRKQKLVDLIKYYDADFVGVQEAQVPQLDFIKQNDSQLDFIGEPRSSDKNAEYSAIFYKKDQYKVLEQKTMWLSETPEKESKGWDAAYNRIITYGLFQDKKTKKKFWIINTHFDNDGKIARQKSLEMIDNLIQKLTEKKNVPAFFMGDFNMNQNDESVKYIQNKYLDTRLNAQMVYGPDFTWEDFKFNVKGTEILDYIFYKKNSKVTCKSFNTIDDFYDFKYPSDHLPILAKFLIQ
ncbi:MULTISPECIES: endonuclease/exonuclease/phosphatase family protein [unclassified Empedobacter]|uniref:endonuclease/exonuclease/phosphatase family protein n=1 Tax=unclassified Empedobacter TaxID=2643773 RepID=UPI0025B9379E|nr:MULTISPECIES: endonuclease/exonuclease/phosphatase family protein [unclassified Empedobacter]